MAEGGMEEVPILCRYYLNGCCREGNHCRFSHDRQAGKPDLTCRYYLAGNCFYGDRCRFDHMRRSNSSRINQTNSRNNSSKSDNSNSNEKKSGEKPKFRNLSKSYETEDWVKAPEFVPRQNLVEKSYAAAVDQEQRNVVPSNGESINGYCFAGPLCTNEFCGLIHGDLCEFCDYHILHPTEGKERKKHIEECIKMHEQLMEHSFAISRSRDKTCGICMDVILDKDPPSVRRFGILPNCSHIFCLECIRKWRQAKQFENKIIRACPECRVCSDFVVPSRYWVENEEEKVKLFRDYKEALRSKPCKHFKEGRGECPFANKCFYLHAYPDGTKADLGPPKRRRRQNADGDFDLLRRILLWEFIEEREIGLRERDIVETLLGSDDDDEDDTDDYDFLQFLSNFDSDSDGFSLFFYSDSETDSETDD